MWLLTATEQNLKKLYIFTETKMYKHHKRIVPVRKNVEVIINNVQKINKSKNL